MDWRLRGSGKAAHADVDGCAGMFAHCHFLVSCKTNVRADRLPFQRCLMCCDVSVAPHDLRLPGLVPGIFIVTTFHQAIRKSG